MKRTRGQAFGPQQGGVRKTRKGNKNRGYSPNSVVQPRVYVPRTPGGNIVADNHYFDLTKLNAAIPVVITSWSAAMFDPDSSSGGAIASLGLFQPVQGDDITRRQGRKCFLKKIRITGSFSIPSQATQTSLDTPAKVRIIVYCDKQTNGAQATGADLINSGSTGAGAIHMFQNFANLGRFQVYKDKSYLIGNSLPTVNNTGGAGGIVQGSAKTNFKFTINVNKWVNFNAGVTGTITDVVDNSFHVLAATDGVLVVPTLEYSSRCTFAP